MTTNHLHDTVVVNGLVPPLAMSGTKAPIGYKVTNRKVERNKSIGKMETLRKSVTISLVSLTIPYLGVHKISIKKFTFVGVYGLQPTATINKLNWEDVTASETSSTCTLKKMMEHAAWSQLSLIDK